MIRALLLMTLIIPNIVLSQELKSHEKKATQCLEEKLSKANVNRDYIFDSFEEYMHLVNRMEIEALDAKQREIDSILTICGFFQDNQLNTAALIECFEQEYDFNSSSVDSSSSYYNVLSFLKYWQENQELIQQLSPEILLDAMSFTMNDGDKTKVLYRLSTFIIFQGIMCKSKNYSQSYESQENKSSTTIRNEEMIITRKGDNKSSDNDPIFVVVDEMPKFPGGEKALKNYLNSEPVHPDKKKKTKGIVFVQFIIDKSGKVTDPMILRGLTPLYDQEAIRVIKNMPDWSPGIKGGKKVKVQFTYPVEFK